MPYDDDSQRGSTLPSNETLDLIALASSSSAAKVPSALSDELKMPTARKTKRLDDLIRNACNGEFHMKKYIAKDSEQFLQVGLRRLVGVSSAQRALLVSGCQRRNLNTFKRVSTAWT